MNAPRRPNRVRLLPPLLLLAVAAVSRAQTSQQQQPFWTQPQIPRSGTPVPGAPPQATTPTQSASPAAGSSVIARIEGKPITQADYDRVAQPYFARLRAQMGDAFQGDVVKLASHNVLDELLRRELMRIEAQRQKIVATQADIDSILARDPFFWSAGTFDRAKFEQYKSAPTSNYQQMLPELRTLAAMDAMDRQVRQRLTPTPAEVRAEWSKRGDRVRYGYLALLQREMSLEPESTEPEWEAFYQAHSDRFFKKTRVRLRYVKLPLPAAEDSTRPAEEKEAQAEARAIADSIAKGTLPDTSARLSDTGLFDATSPGVPGLGAVPEIEPVMARADTDSTVRQVGPVVVRDGVLVGVISERQPRHLPPMREVLGDVKRQADAEKRRTVAEQDRRRYYEEHADHWRTTRMSITRVSIADAAIPSQPPSRSETDRWYAAHGRAFLSLPDTAGGPLPPLDDSLRAHVRPAVEAELRPAQVRRHLDRVLTALKGSRDVRSAARSAGAAVDTLTMFRGGPPDSLFLAPFVDSLYASALERRGDVQGPRLLLRRWVAWRVDSADTASAAPFEAVRGRVEQEFRQEQRRKDEEEAQVTFEKRRTDYKTPLRFGIDYVAVKIPPADSVRISDATLHAYYDTHKDQYRQEEQVKARHILLSTREPGANEAQAKLRADSLLRAVKSGADFVDLAKRFSQEPGAATSGGDLGWFGRGRMVKEFETAAFALDSSQTSDIVKTQFGYHIIRVEGRRPAGIRPLNEVRPTIRNELAAAQGDTTARRTAQALRRKLTAGGDVAALAKPYGGVSKPAPFAVTEQVPGLGFVEGQQELPNLTVNRWAPRVYRAGSQYIVLRVRERVPPRQAEFDEVKTQAVEDTKNAKRGALMDSKVAAIRSALAAGGRLDSLAAPYGGVKDSGPLAANTTFAPPVGNAPNVVTRALAMKPGEVSDTLQTPAGVMWIRLDEHVKADPASFKAQRQAISQEMLTTRLGEWVERKKKTVRIEILRADLKEPKPPTTRTVTMSAG